MDTSFKEIALKLYNSDNILIFPHVGIDGDAVGSSVSLAHALRKLGKNCWILYADDIPGNLRFLVKDYFTADKDIIPNSKYEIACAVDCGELTRFPDFVDKFEEAPLKICMDHHGTSIMRDETGEHGLADMNIIEPEAAAAGEIVFRVLKELDKISDGKILPDDEIGIAIFAALTTDTGNFQYSNTRAMTHEIMAEIYSWGVKTYPASVEIYENERINRLEVEALCLDRMEITENGRVAVSYVTYDELKKLDIREGETEQIIKRLRSIQGVEYAAFLKEKEPGLIRVSLRAKLTGDVAAVSKKFNGGGHKKAAGCTLNMPLEQAVKAIKTELVKLAEEL